MEEVEEEEEEEVKAVEEIEVGAEVEDEAEDSNHDLIHLINEEDLITITIAITEINSEMLNSTTTKYEEIWKRQIYCM